MRTADTVIFDEYQERIRAWQLEQFGDSPIWQLVLGIGEELGEFAESLDTAEELDALADMTVYSMQLCSHLHLQFSAFLPEVMHGTRPVAPAEELAELAAGVGKIQHAVLKRVQGIRGMNNDTRFMQVVAVALRGLVGAINHAIDRRGYHYARTLADVADEVLKRDWRNHPQDAPAHSK